MEGSPGSDREEARNWVSKTEVISLGRETVALKL